MIGTVAVIGGTAIIILLAVRACRDEKRHPHKDDRRPLLPSQANRNRYAALSEVGRPSRIVTELDRARERQAKAALEAEILPFESPSVQRSKSRHPAFRNGQAS